MLANHRQASPLASDPLEGIFSCRRRVFSIRTRQKPLNQGDVVGLSSDLPSKVIGTCFLYRSSLKTAFLPSSLSIASLSPRLALPQGGLERENAVDDFRAGKTWVLIATDVIARGMDFKGVNCVINYDFPDSAAAYIHRIGRSGRAGRSGEAISFYTEDDIPFLRNVANVMSASGCEVPSWIMALPKLKGKKHRPRRDSISTKPKDE